MKPLNIVLAATAAAAAVAAFSLVSSQARATGNLVIAQMMNDDKGKQGMGGMEGHGGTAGSNMQPQGQGGCPGGQCGPMQGSTMQGQPGMQGRMMGGMGAMPDQGMQGPPMMQGHIAELPSDHIEGRLAYLHAELRISEAQMPAWSEFANALRANAKRMSDMQAMPSQSLNKSVADRLDDQERWLAARLESVRALKPAYGKLYAVLDDKQKKSADELIVTYLGVR